MAEVPYKFCEKCGCETPRCISCGDCFTCLGEKVDGTGSCHYCFNDDSGDDDD